MIVIDFFASVFAAFIVTFPMYLLGAPWWLLEPLFLVVSMFIFRGLAEPLPTLIDDDDAHGPSHVPKRMDRSCMT